MPRRRQLAPLILDEKTRSNGWWLFESSTLPHSVVLRAKIVLASREGLTNSEVPQRFLDSGLSGLHDELRPGRPRRSDDEAVAALTNRAL